MDEMMATLRLETSDLTVRKIVRWGQKLTETFEDMDAPVEAKRRDTGEIYLQVKGAVT